jgi:hypothetical protein
VFRLWNCIILGIRIEVQSRIRIRISIKSRIWIRISPTSGALESQNEVEAPCEAWMVCRPVVSDLHYPDEEPDPDVHPSEKSEPDLHQSEKPDPDPHQQPISNFQT